MYGPVLCIQAAALGVEFRQREPPFPRLIRGCWFRNGREELDPLSPERSTGRVAVPPPQSQGLIVEEP